jgi:predicted RNA binding protein YcfA (HicA-like mRNA interferase family)
MGKHQLVKEVREVVDYASGYGFTLQGTSGGNHVILRHSNGRVIIPGTPGGGRWERNAKALIRRIARGA